jgi:hypothetical protein
MAVSQAFAWVSNEVARATSLNEMEARGTLRLALKEAGLEPSDVDANQMRVVLEQLLPKLLESRGISDASAVCSALLPRIPRDAGPSGESAARVFERLAGR